MEINDEIQKVMYGYHPRLRTLIDYLFKNGIIEECSVISLVKEHGIVDSIKILQDTECELTRRWGGFDSNLKILRESGLEFQERETAVLFREKGKPKIDFYPHTGRWRIVGKFRDGVLHAGGANKFVKWYKERSNKWI